MVVFIRSPSVQLPMFMTFVDIRSDPSLKFGWYLSWVQIDWKSSWKYGLSMVAIVCRRGLHKYLVWDDEGFFPPVTAQAKFCYKLALMKWLCSPTPDRYSLWPCPQVGSWSTDLGYADKKMSSAISMKAGFYCFPAFVWGWSFTTLQFISRHPEANVLWICIFHNWFLNTAHIGT